MKLSPFFAYGCCIVTCMQLAMASPYAHANAEADPEPEPLVGQLIKKVCRASTGDVKSHKDLCRAAANNVVEKVAKTCHKAIKYGCGVASIVIKYDTCYDIMKYLICPANQPETIAIEPAPNATVEVEIQQYEPKDDGKHPAWIGRVVIRKCEQYVRPIADNITDNGQADFNSTAVCKELGHQGRDVCKESLISQCDFFPKSWTKVARICKNTVVPWICK